MNYFCAFLAIFTALITSEFFVKTLEFRNIFLHSPLVNYLVKCIHARSGRGTEGEKECFDYL